MRQTSSPVRRFDTIWANAPEFRRNECTRGARVRYYPNAERTAYYVEVEKGWMGKPDLKMQDEFWHETDQSITLC
jgi:hypothetical protein